MEGASERASAHRASIVFPASDAVAAAAALLYAILRIWPPPPPPPQDSFIFRKVAIDVTDLFIGCTPIIPSQSVKLSIIDCGANYVLIARKGSGMGMGVLASQRPVCLAV